MLTVTPPPPAVALIPVPNSPLVVTLVALTCTDPVVVARIPTALEPSVVLIGPEAYNVDAAAAGLLKGCRRRSRPWL